MAPGDGGAAATRGVDGESKECREKEKKIQRRGESDAAIYGRLVVMVISREGEEGMKLSG